MLILHHLVLKWDLFTNPLSLYGRCVRRTGTAGCTGTTCPKHAKMSASLEMLAAADILTLFLMKSQNPNSAQKCPITSIQVCTESQKLSEFSRVTFKSLKRGCAAKALFSCPAIISQRLEPRITSNGPLENTEEESKII